MLVELPSIHHHFTGTVEGHLEAVETTRRRAVEGIARGVGGEEMRAEAARVTCEGPQVLDRSFKNWYLCV